MTQEEITDNQMKEDWRMSAEGMGKTTLNVTNEILSGRHQTALERLRQRYKRFMILGFICAAILPCWYYPLVTNQLVEFPIWGIMYMTVYFLCAAIMDWTLIQRIDAINVFKMPTSEVIRKAYACRKLHLTYIAILAPLAFGLVGIFLWQNWDNVYVLAGIISGFVAGLAIGLYQLTEFLKDYRSLTSE